MSNNNARFNALIFILLLVSICCLGQSNSVLSTGQWAKLAITSKGVYKIDSKTLSDAGFDPGTVVTQNIQLHGWGGGMLPQSNLEPRPSDLLEVAIVEMGLEDGSFDKNDYLLFYAEGPNVEQIDANGHLIYEKNLYSDTTFYFLTIGNSPGKRMTSKASLGTNYPQVSSYSTYYYYENERENILTSGRHWFGEMITASSRVRIRFENAPSLVTGTPIEIVSSVVNSAESAATFTFSVNASSVGSIDVEAIGSGTYDDKGVIAKDTLESQTIQVNDRGNLDFEIGYQGAGSGFLDYFTTTYETPLTFKGETLFFTSPKSLSNAISSYVLDDFPEDATIWEVTEPSEVAIQQFAHSEVQAQFGSESQILKKFVVFQNHDLPTPVAVAPLQNQNIHGMSTPDMLIVTHKAFVQQAQRLASFRSMNDGLEVIVLTTEEIYNEFSSGRQDVSAIRDMVKSFYDKSNRLKYLLLFGRCSYDYKNRTNDNTNFVPTYQSRNSTDPIYSYNSDDFFGFLDEDEGEWSEQLSGSGGHLLDISVGRLPVTSNGEASIVVDKLIHYSNNQDNVGSWRKKVYYVADDGDFNLHQRDADRLATMIDTTHKEFDVKKIYMDAYPQEETPNGESADAVNQELEETIKKGALIINYTGHGSEFRWAQETILSHNMINSFENLDRLPVFVTATCEFGRYDDPKRISGAEKLILNPKGGAIGLVTTARPVFASKNFILNRAFYEVALNRINHDYPTLGEIFQHIKNDSYNIVANRNFALLGDPSMKLAYPQNSAIVSEIIADGQAGDTIKALSSVKIRGKILETDGSVLSGYEGIAEITVYDEPETIETLGSDGGRIFTFDHRNNVIFRGQATVKSGEFEIDFIAPKKMNQAPRAGKISVYALSTNELGDAGGSYDQFLIGGINKNAPEDNTPPEVTLYMDDLSFTSGGSTGKRPVLLARLTDDSGINVTSTEFDQDITALLDSDQTVVLNDFFKADQDSYKGGWVRYPLNELNDGLHTLTLKVWDIYGNSSEASIDFIVNQGAGLAINELHNFPNPFDQSTTFFIDHNRPGEDLDVNVKIFDRQGRLVHQILTNYENSPSTIRDLEWNGTSGTGVPLENGVYMYQVTIISGASGNKNVSNQKMILIK